MWMKTEYTEVNGFTYEVEITWDEEQGGYYLKKSLKAENGEFTIGVADMLLPKEVMLDIAKFIKGEN